MPPCKRQGNVCLSWKALAVFGDTKSPGPACSLGTSSGCSACTMRTICCPGSEAAGCSRRGTSQIGFRVRRGQGTIAAVASRTSHKSQDPTAPAPPPNWAISRGTDAAREDSIGCAAREDPIVYKWKKSSRISGWANTGLSELREGDFLFAYLDDIYAVAQQHLWAHCRVHTGKTQVWNKGRRQTHSLRRVVAADPAAQAWRGSGDTDLPKAQQGMKVLGTSIFRRGPFAEEVDRAADV